MPRLSVTPHTSLDKDARVWVSFPTENNDLATGSDELVDIPCCLAFRHGEPGEVTIRASLSGPDATPVLLVAGGISAGRHVLARRPGEPDGWWQSQSSRLAQYRLLAIDWLGADGTLDRPIDPLDQARAMLSAMDHFALPNAKAFLGASYGAMVGMHLAAIAPVRIGKLLAISASASAHPFTSAQRAVQRQIVELAERLGDAAAGVSLARKLAMLGYRTDAEFATRFAAAPVVRANRAVVSSEAYLDAQGDRHRMRMSATAYRRLSESIDLHQIEPSDIRVPVTFVGADSDRIVPLADIEWLAERTGDGRMCGISSLYGHDAFLKEEAAIGRIIEEFLHDLEK